MKKQVGGIWNLEDKTPKEFVEKHGYDYENLYEELDTLVPSSLMSFKDFPNQQEEVYENKH